MCKAEPVSISTVPILSTLSLALPSTYVSSLSSAGTVASALLSSSSSSTIHNGGISRGDIEGIVWGVVGGVGVIIMVAVIVVLFRRNRRQETLHATEAIYGAPQDKDYSRSALRYPDEDVAIQGSSIPESVPMDSGRLQDDGVAKME